MFKSESNDSLCAILNDETLEGFKIPQSIVLKGGVLKLKLGSEPNKTGVYKFACHGCETIQSLR
jgi:putative alpha-1,2-mannosidase